MVGRLLDIRSGSLWIGLAFCCVPLLVHDAVAAQRSTAQHDMPPDSFMVAWHGYCSFTAQELFIYARRSREQSRLGFLRSISFFFVPGVLVSLRCVALCCVAVGC